MTVCELHDGFNIYSGEKVFWLSRDSGWTREQVAQIRTILDDYVQRLEAELADTENQRHDLNRECDNLRDEIWSLRDKLSAVMSGVID